MIFVCAPKLCGSSGQAAHLTPPGGCAEAGLLIETRYEPVTAPTELSIRASMKLSNMSSKLDRRCIVLQGYSTAWRLTAAAHCQHVASFVKALPPERHA